MSYKKLKDTWIVKENYVSPFNSTFDYPDNLLGELKSDNLAELEYLYQLALKITKSEKKIEGNLYTPSQAKNRSDRSQENHVKIKKMARVALNPNIKSYLEVGVNSGHSLLNVLQNSRSIKKVLLFDINHHKYVEPAVKYITNKFPHIDINFIKGDSTKTIPNTNVDQTYDLIHIDGGHSFDVAYADIKNCKKFAHKNTLLIIDDCHYNKKESCLGGAVKKAIKDNIINVSCCKQTKGQHLFAHYIL